MNEYRDMIERIHTPEALHDRVLAAAARQEQPAPRRRQPALRAAVCGALALALVLGSVTLRPANPVGQPEQAGDGPVLPQLTYEFALTAYAAEEEQELLSGGRPGTVNGSLLLGARDGGTVVTTTELKLDELQYTAYRFRVRGENIQTVTLAINQGGLYRFKLAGGNTPLGPEVTEDYDPDAIYGLWAPVNTMKPLREQTFGVELFDGAELTVTALFTDGRSSTQTYTLTGQRLQTFENEDGAEVLIPALEGGAGSVSGLYAESAGGVWFRWPVEGSSTVSLSNRYGYRTAPGGKTKTFHAGIDIPAEQGTAVTAAAAGTVVKAEFDADKGNYLVLDHGGGMETVYAHCLSLSAEAGDTVTAGDEIAAVGSTGKSTGPHLCFQVWQDGAAQNPVAYFDSDIRNTLKME